MEIEVKVPVFPESVSEGSLAAWHKRPGDAVRRDEVLADIETDKVMFEVPSPADGVLREILEQEGAEVSSGQLLARIETAAAGRQAAAPPPEAVAGEPAPETSRPEEAPVFISPAARRLIDEHSLDATAVSGTGKGGRILKEDVLRALEEVPQEAEPSPAVPSPPSPTVEAVPGAADGERPQRRVPMTRLRARIAERLVEAQRNAAILSTFNEVNMAPVLDLRARYRERFEQEHGVRLGLMSFFVKATVEALRRMPEVNASIDGEDIIYHGFFDIGIAVSSPRGLVVPILRDADRLSMVDIESRIAGFAHKAREGTLSLEEITGGTFTITNGGIFGSLLSTPILNPPQSAILGMHRIQQRPVAESGEVVIRPMMYLALSYDHRIIDGQQAVQFLVMIKDFLEEPASILLEV